MTTDPISRDESLNGSWVELNDAYSPPQSPMILSPAEYNSKSPSSRQLSLAESVKQLGLISIQVDKILREAKMPESSDSLRENKHNHKLNYKRPSKSQDISWSNTPDLVDSAKSTTAATTAGVTASAYGQLPNSDGLSDALSDSISLVEAMMSLDQEQEMLDMIRENHKKHLAGVDIDTDWFWDWSSRPEFFSKEWKMQEPVKRPRLSLRQWASKRGLLSDEVLSLLFLTNILSVIIGAGISYTIMMRKCNPS